METHGNKQVLDALTQQYDHLAREIKEKMELQAAVALVKAHFEGLAPTRVPYVPSRRWEDSDTNLTGLLVDFSGARNTVERIIRIGEAAEGKLLNSTVVARFLIDSEESRGKVDTVRRDVGQLLKGHPEYFEPVSTGTYRFLGRDATVPIPPLGSGIPNGSDINGLPPPAAGGVDEDPSDSERFVDPSISPGEETNDDYDE